MQFLTVGIITREMIRLFRERYETAAVTTDRPLVQYYKTTSIDRLTHIDDFGSHAVSRTSSLEEYSNKYLVPLLEEWLLALPKGLNISLEPLKLPSGIEGVWEARNDVGMRGLITYSTLKTEEIIRFDFRARQ